MLVSKVDVEGGRGCSTKIIFDEVIPFRPIWKRLVQCMHVMATLDQGFTNGLNDPLVTHGRSPYAGSLTARAQAPRDRMS